MEEIILDIIKIGRDDGAVQINFSNGANRVFIDFDTDRNNQIHYIGDTVTSFSDVFAHLKANIAHIEGIA